MLDYHDFIEKNKKSILYGGGGVILLAISLQLFNVITTKPEAVKQPPYVRTMTIDGKSDSATLTYPGEVRGRQESVLAFQVGGRINQRLVKLGDTVEPGQVLLTIDPKDVQQSAEAANAALASAVANQKLAADNANRFRQLYQGGAVGKATLDQYNTQLEAANATLRQAQAQATVANNQLEYTRLRSNARGTVAALNGEVGQVVGAGTPIATVIATGQPEVHIHVPENVLGKIKTGQGASVTLWALEGLELKGTVREIASMADPLTKTYKVAVALEQLPNQVKLGMTAKVAFTPEVAVKEQFFYLPTVAIYKANDKTQVWKVKGNKAVLAEITVEGYKDNQVKVSKGLEPGDIIITAGLAKLTPNQEVRLLEGGDK